MSNLDNVTQLKHINNLAAQTASAINELLINGLSGVGTADVFTGATSVVGGASGFVPAPAAGDDEKFLRGDGTWATVPTVAGGASSDVIIAGSTVLDTTPVTVDGGMWYEINNPYIITKIHYGNKNYTINKFLMLAYDYCVSWLPFDTSLTADKCGNSWTAYGTPIIKAGKLQLDGNSSYLAMDGGITLGGQDFTIRGKFNMANESGEFSRVIQIFNTFESTADSIVLYRDEQPSTLNLKFFTLATSTVITFGQEHDFELDYSHAEGTVRFFLDGELKGTLSKTLARTNFVNVFLGKSNYSGNKYFVGTIDEFMIFDGVALHTETFTPPTADDYGF